MPTWKEHLPSSIAGAITIAQFVSCFFISAGEIEILRWLGWLIWIISVTFGWLPMVQLKRYGRVADGKAYVHTSQLVRRGLYGIVRHPQYTALPLLNISLMLITQHWLIILLGIPPILLMIPDLCKADNEGLAKFGDEYRAYAEQVPKVNFVIGLWRWMKRRLAKQHNP